MVVTTKKKFGLLVNFYKFVSLCFVFKSFLVLDGLIGEFPKEQTNFSWGAR